MFSASYFQMLSEYYSILKDTHYISNSSSITDHTDATKLGSYAWVRAQIGSENRKVYFPARSTPYIFPDDYTTSTYTEISLLPGAIVSIPTGKTLTISKFDAASAGDRRCFSGVGSVAFADGAVSWINSAWFPGGDTDAGVIFARGNIPIWIKADGSVEANGIAPTMLRSNTLKMWLADVGGAPGKEAWHVTAESGMAEMPIVSVILKDDTGDPTQVHEGLMVINTYDNNIKLYAEGAWRILWNSYSPTWTLPPSGPDATGTAGQTAWDQNYIYRCVATNTWKRIPLSTW